MRRLLTLTLVAVLALGVVALGAGTKDDPYRLILVPSTDVAVVASTGDAIAAALTKTVSYTHLTLPTN